MTRSLATAAGWSVGLAAAFASVALLQGALDLRPTPITALGLFAACAALGQVVGLVLHGSASKQPAPLPEQQARPAERRPPVEVPARPAELEEVLVGRAVRGAAAGGHGQPGAGADRGASRQEWAQAPAAAARPAGEQARAVAPSEDAVTRFIVLALPVVVLVVLVLFLRR
jgi:hypothetical protein